MSFSMVRHTQEDVDAFFSKVALHLWGKKVNSLPSLMAKVWESKGDHPVSSLITEVVDYRAYIESFKMEFDIIGQSQPVAFHFSIFLMMRGRNYTEQGHFGWSNQEVRSTQTMT